jgi:DNA topoisomerase IB
VAIEDLLNAYRASQQQAEGDLGQPIQEDPGAQRAAAVLESLRKQESFERSREKKMRSLDTSFRKTIKPDPKKWTGPSPMMTSPALVESYEEAKRTGLLPKLPEAQELRGAGLMPPEEQPWWMEYLLKPVLTGLGGAAELDKALGPVTPRSGMARKFVGELSQQFRQLAQPDGVTVRDPTVLSTMFDAAETIQRVAVVLPVERMRGDYPDESLLESVYRAAAFPSWAKGRRPRDMVSLTRRMMKEQGYNPDSGWGMLFTFGTAGLTDPVVFSGLGAVRRSAKMVAFQQALKLGKKALRQTADPAVLDGEVAALGRILTEIMADPKNDIPALQPVVRDLLGGINPSIGRQFDELGDSWGQVGLRVGVPLLQERVPWTQIELVSHKTLRKPWEKVRSVGQSLSDWGGELVRRREGQNPLDVAAAVRLVRSLIDPSVEFSHLPGLRRYFQQRSLLDALPEHRGRMDTEQLEAVSKQYTTGVKKGRQRPILMGTGDLASELAGEDWRFVLAAERQYVGAALDSPNTAAREARSAGVLDHPSLVTAERRQIPERAYAKAIALSEEADPAETFRAYIVEATGDETLADALSGQASRMMPLHELRYKTIVKGLDARLQNLWDFHQGWMKRMHAAEKSRYKVMASRAAKYEAATAKALARGAGKSVAEARMAGSAAAKDAHKRIMAKMAEELENYQKHFIRDRISLKVPLGVAAEKSAKHRKKLSLQSMAEDDYNPADDVMVNLASRIYSHNRFNARMDHLDLALSDSRWARRLGPSGKSNLKSPEWDPYTHPITEVPYMVRREVIKDLIRADQIWAEPKLWEKLVKSAYDSPMARWKSYATHARVTFYNMRNQIDDRWRMAMGGYDFNPNTERRAIMIGLLGRLEGAGAVKGVARAGRRPAKYKGTAIRRDQADKVVDNYDAWLLKSREKTYPTKLGTEVSYGDTWDAMGRYGIVEKGFMSADLMDDIPRQLEHTAMRFDPAEAAMKTFYFWRRDHVVLGQGGFMLRATGKAARWFENQRRMTLFVDRVQAGESFADAARIVNKWLFDYKAATPLERQILTRAMPFYKFQRKNTPRQIEAFVRHPGRYLAVHKAKRTIEEKAESEFGPIGVVADYMDSLGAVRWGQTPEGSPVFVNIGLAMTDLNALGSVEEFQSSSDMWDRVTPVLDVIQMLRTNRDPFTQRHLGVKGEEVWDTPGPVLMALVRRYNRHVPSRYEVAVHLQTLSSGYKYETVPAKLVWAWKKSFPNFVSYGRIWNAVAQEFGDKLSDDPFEREQAVIRLIRELSGVSPMVNNPVKQELGALYEHGDVVERALKPRQKGVISSVPQ